MGLRPIAAAGSSQRIGKLATWRRPARSKSNPPSLFFGRFPLPFDLSHHPGIRGHLRHGSPDLLGAGNRGRYAGGPAARNIESPQPECPPATSRPRRDRPCPGCCFRLPHDSHPGSTRGYHPGRSQQLGLPTLPPPAAEGVVNGRLRRHIERLLNESALAPSQNLAVIRQAKLPDKAGANRPVCSPAILVGAATIFSRSVCRVAARPRSAPPSTAS